MIIKVMEHPLGYAVHYGSGRVRVIYKHERIPKTVKAFMDGHPPRKTESGELIWERGD